MEEVIVRDGGTTLATILGYITDIVTSAISWVTSFVTLIAGQPLLLLFVIAGFALMAISMIKRLLRV